MLKLGSYAKINLSLDVIGRRENGYHDIESVMQGIGLHDDVIIGTGILESQFPWEEIEICGMTLRLYFRVDEPDQLPPINDNLVTKGVRAFLDRLMESQMLASVSENFPTLLSISVDKRLPVSAGIAGGSGNAAVAMLGINEICGEPFSLEELMDIGATVGADIPFCLSMNACMNKESLRGLRGIENASVAGMMRGIGDSVEPIKAIERSVILMNPRIAVSTKEVYEAIDKLQGQNKRHEKSESQLLWRNVMEEYTLDFYEEAKELADAMKANLNADKILMSGSGPTMVAYYTDLIQAELDYRNAVSGEWINPEWMICITETGKEMV